MIAHQKSKWMQLPKSTFANWNSMRRGITYISHWSHFRSPHSDYLTLAYDITLAYEGYRGKHVVGMLRDHINMDAAKLSWAGGGAERAFDYRVLIARPSTNPL